MSSSQVEANRCNAQRSTGPTTASGKARSARNATKHGALSRLKVLPGVERQADWKRHLDGFVCTFEPVGYVEELLVERLAALAWRTMRIVRHESEISASRLENVEADALQRLRSEGFPWSIRQAREAATDAKHISDSLGAIDGSGDDELIKDGLALVELAATEVGIDLEELGGEGAVSLPGVPSDFDELCEFDRWTPGLVRACWSALAERNGEDVDQLRVRIGVAAFIEAQQAKATFEALAAHGRDLRGQRLVPNDHELAKIAKHEGHLDRCFYKALHELQRLQAARRQGDNVAPPAAVDVDVDVTHRLADDNGRA